MSRTITPEAPVTADEIATEPVVPDTENAPTGPVVIDYAANIVAAQSALDATIAEARTANTGDMDAFLAIADKVSKAKAAVVQATKAEAAHARTIKAEQFAAKAGERNKVKADIESLEIPPFIGLGLGLGLTIRYETIDGVQVCKVILPNEPRAPGSRGTGRGAPTGERKPIIYVGSPTGTGRGDSIGPRTFLERVERDYAGTEYGTIAANALGSVAKAKVEGRMSPGFDGAKRKLLAAGLGTQG